MIEISLGKAQRWDRYSSARGVGFGNSGVSVILGFAPGSLAEDWLGAEVKNLFLPCGPGEVYILLLCVDDHEGAIL
ncbi:hypothetical protein EYC84_003193 [Monilinia fructicola]|uniref:Uncharacterized protein n=1 Tax=Monilinia fructicola TaxID=38448 RepID=A0A5M9JTR8_MONFR|nr:hypothetical protein EYC84_003193 [Monilinia fructicola]